MDYKIFFEGDVTDMYPHTAFVLYKNGRGIEQKRLHSTSNFSPEFHLFSSSVEIPNEGDSLEQKAALLSDKSNMSVIALHGKNLTKFIDNNQFKADYTLEFKKYHGI